MELLGIKLELPSNIPIVMLREVSGERRVLPIFIGLPEANAIHLALEGRTPARPLTHDLMIDVLRRAADLRARRPPHRLRTAV
jgi:bifunctional DNase/RNase